MKFNFINETNTKPDFIFKNTLKKLVNLTMTETKFEFKLSTFTIVLCDKEKIIKLNKQYRNKNSATDVLSFPNEEIVHGMKFNLKKQYLGEIFICNEILHQQAENLNQSVEREFNFLVIHGLLHLMGYDHDTNIEASEMYKIQNKIFK